MMIRLRTDLVIFLIYLFLSTPTIAQKSIKTVTILPVDSFGTTSLVPSTETTVLDFPLSVSLDLENNTFILDCGTSRILKLNADFKIVNEIGRSGQGPSEFIFTKGIITTGIMRYGIDNRLYVYDRNQRVQVFNTDLELQKTLKLKFISDINIGIDQQVYTLYFNRKKNTLLDMYTKNGEYISSFCRAYIQMPMPAKNNSVLNLSKFSVNESGDILLSNIFHPILKMFNSDGVPKWEKTLNYSNMFTAADLLHFQRNEPLMQFKKIKFVFTKHKEKKLIKSIKSLGEDFYLLLSHKHYVIRINKNGDVLNRYKLNIPGDNGEYIETIDFDISNDRIVLLLMDRQIAYLYKI